MHSSREGKPRATEWSAVVRGRGWVDGTGHEAILGPVEIASIFLVLVVTRPHSLSGLGKPCSEDGRVSLYTHHTSVTVILKLTLAATRRKRQGDARGAAGVWRGAVVVLPG